MKLILGLLALLVSTNICSAAVKGGRIIHNPSVIQDVSQPHLHLSKGGGGGALHHTAVVQDPISGQPVVVDKVSKIGGSGGIKGGGLGGLGAGSAQYALSDGFGRRLYRNGLSQYPFGLLGNDYYSYPNSLLTSPRRVLRRKTVASPNLSGFGPVGLSSALKGGVLVDPTTSQFSIGDAQANILGGGRNLYRSGLSAVPYGLLGSDYYSYPNQLLTQRRLATDFGLGGLGQTQILGGGAAFGAGDAQIRGLSPLDQVSVLDGGLGADFGQRKVTTTTITQSADPIAAALGQGQVTQTTVTRSGAGGLKGLRGGQIFLSGGSGVGGLRRVSRPVVKSSPTAVVIDGSSGLAAPFGGFGQRQVAITKSAPVIAAAPARVLQAPAPVQIVQAAPIQRRVIGRRPGELFLSQAGRPRLGQRIATVARPVIVPQQRVAPVGNIQFTLGGNQIIGGPIVSQAARPVFAAPRQVVVSAAPRQVLTAARPVVLAQRPVISAARPVVVAQRPQVISQVKTSPGVIGRNIFGGRTPQLIYVDGNRRFPGIDIIGGSRIGDPRLGYTQLPISTRRFANLGNLVSSKIGGGAINSPLGLLGRTSPTKVVTQEEVIGPAGDPQIITTVTETGSNNLVPSKIGGPVVSGPLGLGGIGRGGATKVITQEEVVGPAGDPQILTTVTNASPSVVGPSKIGGLAVGGLSGIGGAPTKTITQEEVVGPLGDSQIITTVTQSDRVGPSKIGGLASGGLGGLAGFGQGGAGTIVQQEEVVNPITGERAIVSQEIAQDPIEAALSQATLGDSLSSISSPFGQQNIVDPLGSGFGQASVDDVFAQSALSAVDPFGGTVLGDGFGQQNIADAITQERIASGLGGGLSFSPRVSFLNQYPYDVPGAGLLRSVLSSPVVQQQQEVEQIYVK